MLFCYAGTTRKALTASKNIGSHNRLKPASNCFFLVCFYAKDSTDYLVATTEETKQSNLSSAHKLCVVLCFSRMSEAIIVRYATSYAHLKTLTDIDLEFHQIAPANHSLEDGCF